MELLHFSKCCIYNTRKKGCTGKSFRFSLLETLKNSNLNEKSNPWMATITTFFPKTRTPISNFRKGTPRLPPLLYLSSYAPAQGIGRSSHWMRLLRSLYLMCGNAWNCIRFCYVIMMHWKIISRKIIVPKFSIFHWCFHK